MRGGAVGSREGLKRMRFGHIYATYVHVRLSREGALGKAVLRSKLYYGKGYIYTGIYSSVQAIRAHTVAGEFRRDTEHEHASRPADSPHLNAVRALSTADCSKGPVGRTRKPPLARRAARRTKRTLRSSFRRLGAAVVPRRNGDLRP